MSVAAPQITVAIPAYNRPDELQTLLETVVAQECGLFDVLVVEDHSPRGDEIEKVVEEAARKRTSIRIRCFRNPKNLGYDGNLRRILELSEGEFTLFMGDDDLLRPGALTRVGAAIEKYPNLGVILRAYEHVDFKTGERTEIFRYFPTDRFFPAGPDTIRTFFRRSVSIAGYTVHTATARKLATSRFDGTLLYQLHLSANVLKERDGYFISDALTAMRKDDRQRHFFGSAESEKGRFAPSALTPEHSLNFMRGMLEVAKVSEERLGFPLFDQVVKDLGNYSYAFLRLHAKKSTVFAKYAFELGKLGFARSPYFWVYSGALLFLPARWIDRGIARLKTALPATPNLGGVYEGQEVGGG